MVNIFYGISMLKYRLGASINYVRVRKGGGGFAICNKCENRGRGFQEIVTLHNFSINIISSAETLVIIDHGGCYNFTTSEFKIIRLLGP